MSSLGSMRWRMTLLVLAAACLYLVGNDKINLWDRDEPRYAQTSRQMLQSGDWVVPHFLGEVRTAKPVFIYWCQATAMRFFGDTPFAARLPSAIGMTLVLIVVGAAVWHGVGPVHALWSVVILATSLMVVAAAKMCFIDAVLLVWIAIAQICTFVIYQSSLGTATGPPSQGRWWVPLVLWVAVGLAGLSKGPVVLGVLATTLMILAAFDVGHDWRRPQAWLDAISWWRRLRPLLGILIVAAMVGPWLYMVRKREPTFISKSIAHEIWERMHTGLEQHKGPPGYYVVTILGMFMPWSLLLPGALALAWKNRALCDIRFALSAIIGPWIMFELIQTKLPHYLLPIYPAMALLCADLLVRCVRREERLVRPSFLVGAAVWALAILAIGAVPWLAMKHFITLPWTPMAAISIFCVVWAAAVFLLFRWQRIGAAAGAMAGGMVIFVTILCGWYLPQAEFMHLPEAIAQAVRSGCDSRPGDAIMIDYKEPSLAFYQGGTIREQRDDKYLDNTAPEKWPTWIVLTPEVWRITSIERRKMLEIVATLHGLDYADAKKRLFADVIVARKRTPATKTSLPEQ